MGAKAWKLAEFKASLDYKVESHCLKTEKDDSEVK